MVQRFATRRGRICPVKRDGSSKSCARSVEFNGCSAVVSCSPTAQRLPLVETALTESTRIVPSHLAALAPIDDSRATAAYRHDAALELLRHPATDLAS